MSSSLPPTYDSHSSLTPYLQLPHLLSLTWLAYPVLSIIFVAFRLSISLQSAEDAATSAKSQLITSCTAAEKAATAAASMPRFMAVATNEQFAQAVNDSLNGARAALVLALTVMEAIINFIIDIYRSTFLCLLELVIRGGLAILIAAVNELNSLVQTVANGLRTTIQNDIGAANSAIQSAIDGINKINPFSDIQAPQISVPDLSSLQNVTLPSSFSDSLTQLNNTLPTFNDLKQKLESIIDTPFELLKKDINDTFAGLSFNSSVLPVPEQNLLSFCNDLDTSVIDDLRTDLVKFTKIGIIILILFALVLIGLNCLLEWYKWRCMKRHLQYTREAWTTDPTLVHHAVSKETIPQVTMTDHNLLLLQANSTHPLLTRIANTLSARLRLTPAQHTHLSWFFHYVFHPPALACFIIGFFGLLTVEIQLLAIGPLQAKYSAQATTAVSDFSNTIATSINASMYNQSANYAKAVNTRVDTIQTTINDGLFGWVNGTTSTLNDTIVAFYDDIQSTVSLVFGGTILEQPAQEFIQCFIGSKVDAIENALTFLHDNLKIDVPRVNDSVLVLSQSSVDEATRPIAAAAIGSGNGDDDSGLVGKLVRAYVKALEKERLMFSIFLGLWGVVVFMAIVIICWHSYGKALIEKRKRKKWQRQQRGGIEGIVVPFREHAPSEGLGSQERLTSFTPMPSPRPEPRVLPSENTQAEKSWESFFSDHKTSRPRTISSPMKLVSFSKNTKGDGDGTKTPWFSRVADALVMKEKPESSKSRPALTISVDPPSSTRSDFPSDPRSRFSLSPKAGTGWLFTKKTDSLPPAPVTKSKRLNSVVPSDVNSVYEQSSVAVPVQSTPLAPPLHHGFQDSNEAIEPYVVYYAEPRKTQGQTLSLPASSNAPSVTEAVSSPAPSENPFVTPFDDEHRVTINHAPARKSIPTNPFHSPM